MTVPIGEHRRALAILAGCPTGATDRALAINCEIARDVLETLVTAKLVRVERRTFRGIDLQVDFFSITPAGRQALHDHADRAALHDYWRNAPMED